MVIHHAAKSGVKKLLALSSICVFAHVPVASEDLLHQGNPAGIQFAYMATKRMIDVQIQACKKQFGVSNYSSIIPANLFGSHDYYNLENGNFLPCLIHKLFLAKRDGSPFMIWGDGTPKREMLFADDAAKIILSLAELDTLPERVIISNNQEYSVRELVEKLVKLADFQGEIIYQTDKPSGVHRRPTNLAILKKLLGDVTYTDMDEALSVSYKWFVDHYPNVRL